MHLWAAEVIVGSGEISAETKAAPSPQLSLELHAPMTKTEEMEEEEVSGAKEWSKRVKQGASFTGSGVYGIASSCHYV